MCERLFKTLHANMFVSCLSGVGLWGAAARSPRLPLLLRADAEASPRPAERHTAGDTGGTKDPGPLWTQHWDLSNSFRPLSDAASFFYQQSHRSTKSQVGPGLAQVVQEAKPLNKDGSLAEYRAFGRACKLVQLETDDEGPNVVWSHLLQRTC